VRRGLEVSYEGEGRQKLQNAKLLYVGCHHSLVGDGKDLSSGFMRRAIISFSFDGFALANPSVFYVSKSTKLAGIRR
jgi:hypothetical protein